MARVAAASRLASLVCVVALLSACRDTVDRRALPTAPKAPARVATTAGTCVTDVQLEQLVNDAFGAGSPDANSALGKVHNMEKQVADGDLAGAKAQAFNIVSFILQKNRQRPLPGGATAVTALVNGVFCYAGLTITTSDATDAFLVYPLDPPQTLLSADGLAGTQLPSDPVSEPTLITIDAIPTTGFPAPGSGPLSTKLDQYPGFYEFAKSSETNAPFKAPVVVGVCPIGAIPADVRARLRLGHNATAGFEITPPASANFLSCPDPTSSVSVALPGWVRTLADALLPSELHAAVLATGGVGGTASEFSPFAPVDPQVMAVGGVGGTANEFTRLPFGARASVAAALSCTAVEAPIGTPLSADCRPELRLRTPLGTPLQGVPTTLATAPGDNGVVAPESAGACGTFGPTALAPSDASGAARACWTLGLTPGTNTVRATPAAGGDVNSPVAYFTPASVTFTATANAPTALRFTQQPAAGSTVVAGAPLSYAVAAVDHNGTTALGWSGTVTLTLNRYTFASGATTASAAASQGVATFTGLAIDKAAAGYQPTASATLLGTTASVLGNAFDVVPAAASALRIVQGNGQTAPAGSVVPVAPTVEVSDAFGNLVAGAPIAWTPGGSSGGSVSPTQSVTGSNGRTATQWTLGADANELLATLARPGLGDLSVLFTATGTTSLSVLNSCAPGNGPGDPVNAPGKTYAFWFPGPGPNKTVREIELYFSSAGKANAPTAYTIELSTQRGSFDATFAPPTTTTATVFLRGSNSESKAATFALAAPIVGASQSPPVMVTLRVLTNPDNSTISFNTGPCAPGSSCKAPPSCAATEVNALTPYPAGSAYRKSVGLVVRGR
ncbi:hypothetical protein J421_4136 [Gemmatirosa kalamazoonensis]|uniref:Big-1 domain-containing protein n=1 Tax=Gemmatirosa kalamazoonensis TaxID=861299 RepID=W0RQ80_9BACT|nr:hypothetical protein [Gemmatirosa kalamazoonensis]AHG91673.1 hypothetical protein J421_4136 [Gemmatirosa kalamazoonensis]